MGGGRAAQTGGSGPDILPLRKWLNSPTNRACGRGTWALGVSGEAMAIGLAALRILVVDDSREMCSIVGTVLTAAGVGQVHYAQNGKRGLEVVAEFPIDVAYVDQEMPVMNGLDFVAAIRAEQSTERYMPIIMLTGHSDLRHINAARDRGVTEFLCKPVTAKAILSRLNAVIMEPRPFMSSPTYFGPDRRRVRVEGYGGPLRRAIDTAEEPEPSQRIAGG